MEQPQANPAHDSVEHLVPPQPDPAQIEPVLIPHFTLFPYVVSSRVDDSDVACHNCVHDEKKPHLVGWDLVMGEDLTPNLAEALKCSIEFRVCKRCGTKHPNDILPSNVVAKSGSTCVRCKDSPLIRLKDDKRKCYSCLMVVSKIERLNKSPKYRTSWESPFGELCVCQGSDVVVNAMMGQEVRDTWMVAYGWSITQKKEEKPFIPFRYCNSCSGIHPRDLEFVSTYLSKPSYVKSMCTHCGEMCIVGEVRLCMTLKHYVCRKCSKQPCKESVGVGTSSGEESRDVFRHASGFQPLRGSYFALTHEKSGMSSGVYAPPSGMASAEASGGMSERMGRQTDKLSGNIDRYLATNPASSSTTISRIDQANHDAMADKLSISYEKTKLKEDKANFERDSEETARWLREERQEIEKEKEEFQELFGKKVKGFDESVANLNREQNLLKKEREELAVLKRDMIIEMEDRLDKERQSLIADYAKKIAEMTAERELFSSLMEDTRKMNDEAVAMKATAMKLRDCADDMMQQAMKKMEEANASMSVPSTSNPNPPI